MFVDTFNKTNLDFILKALAQEYKKLGGKRMPAEIILIGGAAIVQNYGFREMTTDVDALIHASSMMKEAINHVGDQNNLPNGWLNEDFKKTDSYSDRISEVSKHYRNYYGVLEIRTVTAEHLIAMKLKSGRKYKNDLSDVAGILAEHYEKGKPITLRMIQSAVCQLYGDWDVLTEKSKNFIEDLLLNDRYLSVYQEIRCNEQKNKAMLISFEEDYPDVVNKDNLENILQMLEQKGRNR